MIRSHSQTMRAVCYTAHGGPEVIQICEIPKPIPNEHQVVVRVHAAGLNRADLLQRKGLYPAPSEVRADIPGLEFAGEVVQVGDCVHRWKMGDRVMAITSGEAHADYVLADESILMKIPPSLSWVEAAAIPEAFITAHDALCTLGHIQSNRIVLIHAIASGVGLAALQLAKEMGAIVIGTTRSTEKAEKIQCLGADFCFVVTGESPQFSKQILTYTKNQGVSVILDFVGAPYAEENMRVLAYQARWVVLGTMGGNTMTINVSTLMRHRAHLIGTVLRSRTIQEKVEATQRFEQQALPMIASRRIKPIVDVVMPMSAIAEAHRKMESNDTFGKIILTNDSADSHLHVLSA